MKFGEKLQKLRKEKGLSQEALAEMLRVSRQAVSKWESGQSYPETENLITLSDIFGVTLDSLVKDGAPQSDGQNTVSAPYWMMRGREYEYKSKKTCFGVPLVHIHVGYGFKKARGIIAIGNVATGVVAIGLCARGIAALGLLSLGLIGLGTFALGLLFALGAVAVGAVAVGAVAVGILATGAVSVGMFSVGALAVGTRAAVGDHAYAPVAVGRVAKGAQVFISSARDFADISADKVRSAILAEFPHTWNWVVNWMTWFLG